MLSKGVPIGNKEVGYHIPSMAAFLKVPVMLISCKIKMGGGSSSALFPFRLLVFEKTAKNRVMDHPVYVHIRISNNETSEQGVDSLASGGRD